MKAPSAWSNLHEKGKVFKYERQVHVLPRIYVVLVVNCTINEH
jgi:hypothetical protein